MRTRNNAEDTESQLEELRNQVKLGQPLNFRNFGLQSSALAELKKRESQETTVKKKDYLQDIHMQKRILS